MKNSKELIDDYLHSALDANGQAELRAWLKQDPANMRRFTQELMFDEQIRAAIHTKEVGGALHPFTVSATSTDQAAPGNIVPLPQRLLRKLPWLAAAAAVVVLGLSLWNRTAPPAARDVDHLVALDSRWILLPAAGADYRILDPNRVKLLNGELRFTSLQPASLVVETPDSTATAQGTDFFIGRHQSVSIKNTDRETNTTMKTQPITRLLVLAGSVTLATSYGAIEATAAEAAIALPGEAPQKLIVEANTSFALDMYHQLAKENQGGNLFFSPYSMSNALLMAAEGARGQTAREMGEVLGFPESLRYTGTEGQKIPWEMGRLHVGQSELNRLLHTSDAESPEQATRKEEETTLANRLEVVRKKKVEAMERRDHQETRKLGAEEDGIVEKLNAVRAQLDPAELRIANAIWGEQTFPILDAWKNTVTTAYGTGAVQAADFQGNYEKERTRINGWAEQQTEGLIKDLFPEGSIDQYTRLAIVNAIHFKGDWQTPFIKSETAPAEFMLGSGEEVKTALMRKEADKSARYAAFHGDGSYFATPMMVSARGEDKAPSYPEQDGFAMVEMPYRGGDLSMVVIAPNDPAGLPALEARLTTDNLATWMKSLKQRETHVFLPKFKMEASYMNLKDSLAAMGMPTAFVEGAADFSAITSSEQVWISTVVHKAYIDVNEEGTEAAAATGVVMSGRSAPASVPFTPTFRADRPFLYLIRDQKSGAILFLGRIHNPSGL